MCKWGNTVIVQSDILKSKKRPDGKIAVDSCIAPLVQCLNDTGIRTIASCCGHGHQPSSIILDEDREIRIMTFSQARKVDKLFPGIDGIKRN